MIKHNNKVVLNTFSFIKTISLSFIVFICVYSCSNNINPVKIKKSKSNHNFTHEITPPLKKNVDFVSFTLDAQKGGEFHITSGTHISIAPNSIIDDNGNLIKGKIKLLFREFHNTKDIFLSGIPMQFNNGNNDFLESAGMVELRASQNDNPVYLKKDSESYIDLASQSKPSSDFSLWYLNKDKDWGDAGDYNNIENERRSASLNKIKKERRKNKLKKKNLFFDLYPNQERFPHLTVWEGTTWECLSGDYKNGYERINWDQVDVEKIGKKKYKIKMSKTFYSYDNKDQELNCEMIAKPIMSKEELQRKNEEYASLKKEYSEFLKKSKLEENRIKNESKLLNRFRLTGFGIYNIDKLQKAEVLVKLKLKFDFEKDFLKHINDVKLYVLLHDRNSVLTYRSSDWDQIPYTNSKTSIVAVLPEGKIAYVDPLSFSKKIKEEELSKTIQNNFTFTTQKASMSKFNDILKQI